MKKGVLTAFVFLIGILFAQAQFLIPRKQWVKDLEKRTLLVIALDEKDKKNVWLNEKTKKYLLQLWQFTPSIEFKTLEETKLLLEENPKKYATLNWYESERTSPYANSFTIKDVYAFGLTIYLDKNEFITLNEVAFPSVATVDEYDIIFAIQELQLDLEAGSYQLYDEDKTFWKNEDVVKIGTGRSILLPYEKSEIEEILDSKLLLINYKEAHPDVITKSMLAKDKDTFFITSVFSDIHFMSVAVLVSMETWEPILFITQEPNSRSFSKNISDR